MCQQGGLTLNFCPLQSQHHSSKQRRLTSAVKNHWMAAGGSLHLFPSHLQQRNREQPFEIMVEWGKNKILFPWKLDWRRRVVGYWLTKFSTLSLIKSNNACKRTSTVPSPLFLYEECKICYPARGQSNGFREILQQVLEIHHIMYLLFLPQATLTVSTMSYCIPWITPCHPRVETITIQPLPLWPFLSGGNITQLAKRKKNSAVTAAVRPSSKEMREVRIFQTAGKSLRSPCVVHQWAQTINTLPFLGSKHQALSKWCPPEADSSLCAWCTRETSHCHCCWPSTIQSHTQLQEQVSQMELSALRR